jgi:hypothetical protein
VTDIEISNGVHLHDVSRYLTAEETGRAIAAGLTHRRFEDGSSASWGWRGGE